MSKPAYSDFDSLFPKMPSYFRRAALAKALGIVSSFRSNFENWEKNGKEGKAPRLPEKAHAVPVFYHDNTCSSIIEEKNKETGTTNNYIELKLLVNGNWDLIKVKLSNTDIKYIRKY